MRIPIRTKLAAALAVPLVALAGGAVYEVVRVGDEAAEAAGAAATVAAETELATAAVGPGSLIGNLQLERNITGVEQLGLQDSLELPVDSSTEARLATDAASDELRAFVAERGDRVAQAFESALGAIDDLEVLREAIDDSELSPGLDNAAFANELFLGYTEIIQVILDDSLGVAVGIDDADLRTGVELVALSTQAYELRSNIVSRIILPLLVNDTSVAARTAVAELVARSDQVDENLLARSTGPYEGLAEAAVLSDRVLGQDALYDTYVADGTAELSVLVEQVSSTGDSGYILLRQKAADALTATASSLQAAAADVRADAEELQQLVMLVAGAAALLALVVSAFASRSITRPLRSLTGQARSMAEDRLPAAVKQVLDTPLGDDVVVPQLAPIKVRTRDEVSDVAGALTTVQGAALELAVEQAVLRRNIADSFVNMSRRNQNLLDRQLSSITELEREEADPERLDGLFRLDHLATRMRRNAESLLRLAGGGGATGGWSGAVPIVDVVRSALGEVEEYQRVELKTLEPAILVGPAGADVAHALAELVENALAFSPPGEHVEVRGRHTVGGYVLAVVDYGVGMSTEQLAVANRRLAGQESFTIAPSRYLGHYVAGHLATAHGITIELRETPAGGTTARIFLPTTLLVSDAAASAPSAPPPVAEPVAEAVVEPVVETVGAPAPRAPDALDDLASWLVPVPSDASSLTDVAIAPAEAPVVVPEPAAPEREAGFGGLVARPLPTALNADTTASGLVKRVRLAQRAPDGQEPVLAPFTSPFAEFTSELPAGPATAADVGDFYRAFSSGVERGLAESSNPESRTDEETT